MTEWKVTSNYIDGEPMYRVYRLVDKNEVDHSGNREYATEYMNSKKKAEKIAAKLNSEGAQQ